MSVFIQLSFLINHKFDKNNIYYFKEYITYNLNLLKTNQKWINNKN
jgi:hypothetical protein